MTQFEKDLDSPMFINNVKSSHAFYNLVVSIRDVKLFQVGIKPHRNWRLTDVKNYFGVKGSKESILAQLEALKEKHFPKK